MKEAIISQAFSRIYGPLSLVKLVCTDAYQMRRNRPGKLQLSVINSKISLFFFFFSDNYYYDPAVEKVCLGYCSTCYFLVLVVFLLLLNYIIITKAYFLLHTDNPSTEK